MSLLDKRHPTLKSEINTVDFARWPLKGQTQLEPELNHSLTINSSISRLETDNFVIFLEYANSSNQHDFFFLVHLH